MEWINAQSNLMDSIRYLMECEISANGVRNLQTCIPAERGEVQISMTTRPESPILSDSLQQTAAAEAAEEVLAAAQQLAVAEEEEVDEEDVEAWS